jgi:hypothetical protein
MKTIKDKTVWKIVKVLLIAFIVFILLSPFIFLQIPKIKVGSRYIHGSEIISEGCISRTTCINMGYSDQNTIEVGDIPYGMYHGPDSDLIVQEDTFRWLGIGNKIKCYHPATAGNNLCVGLRNNIAREECIIGESCDLPKYLCSSNPCSSGECCVDSRLDSCRKINELGSHKDYPNIKISFKKPDPECFRF